MADSKPNLLLILTDQQRADTVAARSAHTFLSTPHLDRLAEEGVWFDAMYSAMPECVPARSMLLTGRYGHQVGVMGNGQRLAPDVPTIAHALKARGYMTQAIGKMHFNPVREPHGFDDLKLSEEIPGNRDDDDYLRFLDDQGFGHILEPHGVRHEYYYIPQVSQVPDALHSTTWVGERTVDFIHHAPARPWFLFASFIKPHPPFDPTIPYVSRYDPEALPPPVDWTDAPSTDFELFRAQDYSKWMEGCDLNLARLIKAAYYACISQVDVQVGRILRALDAGGMREDTLVIFSSDHGELLGDHHHFGKRSFYAGATRVPLIVSWPKTLPAGIRRPQLVGHQDVYGALAEAAGIANGEGLLTWARDGGDGRETLFGELFEGIRAIYMAVTRDFKYQYSPNGGAEQLIALREDPEEARDAGDKYPAVRDDLRARLVDFFRREGYTAPLNADRTGLAVLPAAPIVMNRNRQYPRWHERASANRPPRAPRV